ncbi:MAG: ankyrin repeat domain-containing protein [Legionellaceae bacterium]|nr:ankyrin repeat domain-containing protein [Legionellaceae bacterium]
MARTITYLKKDKQKSKKSMGGFFVAARNDVNHWRELFKNNTLAPIQNEIDEFVKRLGVDYMFLNDQCRNSGYRRSSGHIRLSSGTNTSPIRLGTLLHLAIQTNAHIEIIQYLVGKKHANLNLTIYNNQTPLNTAISKKRFDCALYLLDELEQKSTHDYDSILLDACYGGGIHFFGQSTTEAQIIFIKALLKRGYYLNNEKEKHTNGINLAVLRQEILVSNRHLMQEGHQLVPLTIARMALEHHGCCDSIT